MLEQSDQILLVRRRLTMLLGSLVAFVVLGVLGYVVLERANLLDALFMVLITISTVGYRETVPLSPAGQIWTMLVIAIGLVLASLTFSMLVTLLVAGEVRKVLGRRKLQSKIRQLRGHVIIGGYGRMGQLIAKELTSQGLKTVVIESNPQKTSSLDEQGLLYVLGDASEEESLLGAGVERAKALVTVLPHDADNVYAVLTARGLRSDLFIIARAEQGATEAKLRRAGADKVISPHAIGARRISNILTRPHVVDFVDVAARGVELEMDEYIVAADSPICGKTLRESNLRQRVNVMVVAIKRADGSTVFNPGPNEVILESDILILIGPAGASSQLESLGQATDSL